MKFFQVLLFWIGVFFILFAAARFVFGQTSIQAIGSFGKVGINLPSPQYNLDVHGTARISGAVIIGSQSTGAVTGTGNISTSGLFLDTGTPPTVTACGTAPAGSVTAGSTNHFGQIIIGGGNPGTCQVIFSAGGFPNHAFCTASGFDNGGNFANNAVNFNLQSKTGFTVNLYAAESGLGFQYGCGGN